jgi:hypothetical protein
MDGKTRCSVQYVINLLVLDAIPLFKAVDLAMDRIRGAVSLRLFGYLDNHRFRSMDRRNTRTQNWNVCFESSSRMSKDSIEYDVGWGHFLGFI